MLVGTFHPKLVLMPNHQISFSKSELEYTCQIIHTSIRKSELSDIYVLYMTRSHDWEFSHIQANHRISSNVVQTSKHHLHMCNVLLVCPSVAVQSFAVFYFVDDLEPSRSLRRRSLRSRFSFDRRPAPNRWSLGSYSLRPWSLTMGLELAVEVLIV